MSLRIKDFSLIVWCRLLRTAFCREFAFPGPREAARRRHRRIVSLACLGRRSIAAPGRVLLVRLLRSLGKISLRCGHRSPQRQRVGHQALQWHSPVLASASELAFPTQHLSSSGARSRLAVCPLHHSLPQHIDKRRTQHTRILLWGLASAAVLSKHHLHPLQHMLPPLAEHPESHQPHRAGWRQLRLHISCAQTALPVHLPTRAWKC